MTEQSLRGHPSPRSTPLPSSHGRPQVRRSWLCPPLPPHAAAGSRRLWLPLAPGGGGSGPAVHVRGTERAGDTHTRPHGRGVSREECGWRVPRLDPISGGSRPLAAARGSGSSPVLAQYPVRARAHTQARTHTDAHTQTRRRTHPPSPAVAALREKSSPLRARAARRRSPGLAVPPLSPRAPLGPRRCGRRSADGTGGHAGCQDRAPAAPAPAPLGSQSAPHLPAPPRPGLCGPRGQPSPPVFSASRGAGRVDRSWDPPGSGGRGRRGNPEDREEPGFSQPAPPSDRRRGICSLRGRGLSDSSRAEVAADLGGHEGAGDGYDP